MLTPHTWAALCKQRGSTHRFPQWNHAGGRGWEEHPSPPTAQSQIHRNLSLGSAHQSASCRRTRAAVADARRGFWSGTADLEQGFAEFLFPRPSNHMLGTVGEPQVTDPKDCSRNSPPKTGSWARPEPSWSKQTKEGGRAAAALGSTPRPAACQTCCSQ